MAAQGHLLNNLQMANLVADGYLRFDELVPAHLNAAARAEMESGAGRVSEAGADVGYFLSRLEKPARRRHRLNLLHHPWLSRAGGGPPIRRS